MSAPKARAITLQRARLGYPEHTVLDQVDLQIERGEIVAVLGASGSGKTTLLETIVGLVPPLEGEVRLLGQVVAELDRQEQARLFSRVGVVFQQNALFRDMSVADNLAVLARQQTRLPEAVIAELVTLRLDAVGLHGLEPRRPDSLSGGQQKRVAFARAIMLEPEVLFCDEPTAGLDPLTATKIVELIGSLGRDLGATLFIVTHDLELIRAIVDRVLIIGVGQIYADDRLDALLASPDPLVRGLLRSDHESRVQP